MMTAGPPDYSVTCIYVVWHLAGLRVGAVPKKKKKKVKEQETD